MKKIILLFTLQFSLFTFHCSAQQWFTLNHGLVGNGQYDRVDALCADSFHNILFAGGRFQSSSDGDTMLNLAYWDGIKWNAIISNFGNGLGGEINAMSMDDSLLIVGNNSTLTTAASVLSFNKDSNEFKGMGLFDSHVKAFCIYHDTLYVGGWFTQFDNPNFPFNSNSTFGIAKWTGTEFVQVGGGIGGQVNALCVYNDKLIAAGAFESAGGVTCINIAQWDGTSWAPIGNGIGHQSAFDAYILAVSSYNGKLYAGGDLFGNFGNDLVVWNGTTWGAALGGFNDVYSLSVAKNELFVGASTYYNYWQSTTPWYYCVAEFDDTTWKWTGKGPVYNSLGTIMAFTEWNDSIYVGGKFKYLGDTPQVYAGFVARYDPTTDTTGIKEIKNGGGVSVYPNPAQSTITIETANTEAEKITVTDITGRERVIAEASAIKTTIDIAQLPVGFYIIKVKYRNGSVTVGRFVKE